MTLWEKIHKQVELDRDYLTKLSIDWNDDPAVKLKPENAIAWLAYKHTPDFTKKNGDVVRFTMNKVIDISIDALDKQIPKKPKAEKYMYGKTYNCPSCNIFVGYESDLSLPKYCKCCGQALDWGVENEK